MAEITLIVSDETRDMIIGRFIPSGTVSIDMYGYQTSADFDAEIKIPPSEAVQDSSGTPPTTNTPEPDSLAAKVTEGIALLDATESLSGWRDRVDLSVLDMADADQCILGQLYGNYDEGCYLLELESSDTFDHGFSLPMYATVHFSDLTDEWIRQLGATSAT